MPWSMTIGRFGGTAVRLHITFILFLAWIGLSALFRGGRAEALETVLFIVLIFTCVVLHEFGHIMMARHFGIQTSEVTLLPIGGVANLERIPDNPKQELMVALAGPSVNIVIGLGLILLGGVFVPDTLQHIDDPRLGLLARLAAANLFLAAFNLLPAFPMDGGRVLHALLVMKVGPQKAMQLAARIGQGFAFALGFLGLFGNPILIFIAIFVYIAAAGEAQESILRDTMKGLTVVDAMETRFATITVDTNLQHAVEVLLATPQHEFPVVDAQGKACGVLVREDLIIALRDRAPDSFVTDILRAPAQTLAANMPLEDALGVLSAANAPALSVVDTDGRLMGLLSRENISEMMMIKTMQPEWRFDRAA